MSTLKLNIYKNKKEIEKTYTVESYELMFGIAEDIMNVIDIDKFDDDSALAMMVVKSFPLLKPLLKDVFPGLTDEELRKVKVKEMIPLFKDIIASIIDDIQLLNTGN